MRSSSAASSVHAHLDPLHQPSPVNYVHDTFPEQDAFVDIRNHSSEQQKHSFPSSPPNTSSSPFVKNTSDPPSSSYLKHVPIRPSQQPHQTSFPFPIQHEKNNGAFEAAQDFKKRKNLFSRSMSSFHLKPSFSTDLLIQKMRDTWLLHHITQSLRYIGYLPMPGDRQEEWYWSYLLAVFWFVISFASRRIAYFTFLADGDCPFWMPVGIILGAFLASSPRVRRLLPSALVLSAGMAKYAHTQNLHDACMYTLHALTDYIIVCFSMAYVLRRAFGARLHLTRVSYLMTFTITAILSMMLASVITAKLIVTLHPYNGYRHEPYSFLRHFKQWFGRNVVGIL